MPLARVAAGADPHVWHLQNDCPAPAGTLETGRVLSPQANPMAPGKDRAPARPPRPRDPETGSPPRSGSHLLHLSAGAAETLSATFAPLKISKNQQK